MAYGSPILYPSIPTFSALPVCSMPDSFKLNKGDKNSLAGQYRAGDTIISCTGVNISYNGSLDVNFCNTQTTRLHCRTSISDSNGALALLIVPCNWICTGGILSEAEKEFNQNVYNQVPYSRTVWLVRSSSSTQSDTAYKQAKNSVRDDKVKVKGFPSITDVTKPASGIWTYNTSFDNSVLTLLDEQINGCYKYPPDITLAMRTQYATLKGLYDDALSVLGSKGVTYFNSLTWCTNFCPSLQIESSLPIFDYTQLEDLYKYFKFGDTDGAINDLNISDVDFATDWTIYVNGARKPNIYITMQSTDIDNYLESATDNKGGYSKGDFKIQYRYRQYDVDNFKAVNYGFESALYNERMINDTTYQYNNTRSTSWSELTEKNYPSLGEGFDGLLSGSVLLNPEDWLQVYARLEFRVYLTDTLYSAWCDFGIGIIGSPSVSEFAQMQNWGNVVSINDGSTVTIIYDEVPDDIDDYDEPDDDFPPSGDTDPSNLSLDSALTTTYKVERNQLEILGDYLWGATFFDDIHLINNSPIENIVAVKRLPFSISAGVSQSIVCGNVTTPANGNIVSSMPILDIGTIRYNGYYGNFLDYSPYTNVIIFLPFCGFVTIDASIVTGKALNIKYAVDVILGKCKAMIYIDGAYYMSVDGDCAIDIPLVLDC